MKPRKGRGITQLTIGAAALFYAVVISFHGYFPLPGVEYTETRAAVTDLDYYSGSSYDDDSYSSTWIDVSYKANDGETYGGHFRIDGLSGINRGDYVTVYYKANSPWSARLKLTGWLKTKRLLIAIAAGLLFIVLGFYSFFPTDLSRKLFSKETIPLPLKESRRTYAPPPKPPRPPTADGWDSVDISDIDINSIKNKNK